MQNNVRLSALARVIEIFRIVFTESIGSIRKNIGIPAFAALALTAALAASMVGCSAGPTAEQPTEQPQAPPAAAEQAPEPEPEPAAAPEPTPEPDPIAVSGQMNVHFIDVGQGDSEFIEFPDGSTMLIDAGEASEAGAVVGYVKSLGHSSIDHVVATHPHADHIGGIPAVMSAFDVKNVWAPAVQHTTKTFEAFLDAVANEGLQIDSAARGKSIHSSDGLAVDILSGGASGNDLNDSSAIVKVTFGNTSFLFTGDAGSSVISSCGAGDIDVLKVGHHGSDTSTTASLVSSLAPEFAVISCGAGNSYGHPHESALSCLSKSSTVYRTDVDGTVKATSDGTNITWETGLTTPKAAVSVAAPAAAPSQQAQASPAPESAAGSTDVVYITNTGSKYHAAGCASLRKSQIETTVSDAKAQGYEPCKKCNPPA